MEECPRCGESIVGDENLTVTPTPAIMHAAKLSCSHCGRFIKWQGKDEYETYKAMKEAGVNA